MGPNIGIWVFWSPGALLVITQTLINQVKSDQLKKHLGMYILEVFSQYLPYGLAFSRNTHLQRRPWPGLAARGRGSGCAMSRSANSCERLLSVSLAQSLTSFGAKNKDYLPGDGSSGRSDLSIPPGIAVLPVPCLRGPPRGCGSSGNPAGEPGDEQQDGSLWFCLCVSAERGIRQIFFQGGKFK